MRSRDPIPLLYAAAVGEETWEEAMHAMSRSLHGATVLYGLADARVPSSLEYWSWDFDVGPLQEDGFQNGDLLDPAKNRCVRAAMVMPLRRSQDCRDYFSAEDFREDPFLRHCALHQGIVNGRMFTLSRELDLLAGGFATHRGGAELDRADIRRLDALLDHLAHASRLHTQVNRHRGIAESLQSVLDRLSVGVMLVDEDLRILTMNPTAELAVSARDGLRSERGRLCLSSTPHHRALAASVQSGPGADTRAELSIGVPRPSGLPVYVLRVFPAGGIGGIPAAHGASALITVHDPMAASGLASIDCLRHAFGLSAAEAAVARLAPLSLSKQEIARQLGLSENTVKTHLASVRAKVGARNTGELALIVSATAVGPHRFPPRRT